ncbi:MAG: hypothetical protein Q9170_007333 [Blastenia crenularia]
MIIVNRAIFDRATFLHNLKQISIEPLVIARVIRWIVKPTTLSKRRLLEEQPQWDLLIVHETSAGTLTKDLSSKIRDQWSIQAGVPASLIKSFHAKNARLLHPPTSKSRDLEGTLSKSQDVSSAQNLELDNELHQWITSQDAPKGAVSMLNLLAFLPGRKEEYLNYGKAFADSVGSRRGGLAKLVVRIIQGEIKRVLVRPKAITIVDITDLGNVRYCFLDFFRAKCKGEFDLLTPLSARTYLEGTHIVDPYLPLIQSFESYEVISVNVLIETWSDDGWQGQDLNDASRSTGEVQKGTTKTLREQSMESFLDNILDPSQDSAMLLSQAEALTDFVPKLRRRLYDRAATLTSSPHLFTLLQKALQKETEADLSPFKNLTVDHISQLVANLRRDGMKTLNLSNMPDLTDSDLRTILGQSEQPKTTHASLGESVTLFDSFNAVLLLECPKVTTEFVVKDLGCYDVYHSELFRSPLHRRPRVSDNIIPALQSAGAAVSQMVWVGVSHDKVNEETGRPLWSNAKYSAEAVDGFAGCLGIGYQKFILDIPLSVEKTVNSLRRLLQYLTGVDPAWLSIFPRLVAECFATTSILENENTAGPSVGPLSETLCRDGAQWDRSLEGKSLNAGQWAIVLIHEGLNARPYEESESTKRLRFAFVQAQKESGSSTQPFLVVDVPGFINHSLAASGGQEARIEYLTQWWKSLTSAKGTGYYDEDDITEILDRVYPKGDCGIDNAKE